jgi:hypothetical protein
MFIGFVLRPVDRTVCGMLTGAGLAGVWHHSRAHRFFANTRWDVRQVGLILAALVVELLLGPDDPILLAESPSHAITSGNGHNGIRWAAGAISLPQGLLDPAPGATGTVSSGHPIQPGPWDEVRSRPWRAGRVRPSRGS